MVSYGTNVFTPALPVTFFAIPPHRYPLANGFGSIVDVAFHSKPDTLSNLGGEMKPRKLFPDSPGMAYVDSGCSDS